MTTPASGRHRAPTNPRGGRRVARTRPRYGRMLACCAALAVTVVSVGAGLGIIPHQQPRAAYAATPQTETRVKLSALTGEGAGAVARVSGTLPDTPDASAPSGALPADSGTGRRVVFDQSDQRVWLVGGAGVVRRTYPVSGSLTDNLQPGTYSVYSRSRWAVGVEDSGVMQYFVRFAHGGNAAIGFHTIPTHFGQPLQTKAQLGTPQSHGCIRQATPDAVALWHFAPVGTTVVVVA